MLGFKRQTPQLSLRNTELYRFASDILSEYCCLSKYDVEKSGRKVPLGVFLSDDVSQASYSRWQYLSYSPPFELQISDLSRCQHGFSLIPSATQLNSFQHYINSIIFRFWSRSPTIQIQRIFINYWKVSYILCTT